MNEKQKALETLKFVTGLMNHLSLIGARKVMRKMGDKDILSYTKDEEVLTQMFLEWVYVGNRVGGGVDLEILDRRTIFRI